MSTSIILDILFTKKAACWQPFFISCYGAFSIPTDQ